MNVSIVIGSVRENRVGSRVAKFVEARLKKQSIGVSVIDPRELDIPLLKGRYDSLEAADKPPDLAKVAAALAKSDGFIFVSPEYNGSLPPALVNLVDYFKDEFVRKPVGLVTYSVGPFGGRLVSIQLLMLTVGLGGVPVPAIWPIPSVQDSLNEDGTPTNDDMYGYADNFVSEFSWYLQKLSS